MLSNPAAWFRGQIEANSEAIAWAVAQFPTGRLRETPPVLLGEWPAARQLFHILYYEREVVLPMLQQWSGAPYPAFEGYDENAAWAGTLDDTEVLAELEAVRARELSLISEAGEEQWREVCTTAWGARTLYWVVSKLFQHALEHTNNLLKIALLWEHYETRSRTKAASEAGAQEIE